MSRAAIIGVIWLLAGCLMTCGWRWQRRHANAGIVDVLWAAGLAGSALLCAVLSGGPAAPRLLTGACGAAWGVRLAHHLWQRVQGAPEDGRYAQLRRNWHDNPWKWLALFQFQAALVALFSVPFVIAAGNTRTQPLWLALAALIWCVSVVGESGADRQLARFRADPDNHRRTCRTGLWRYSRHPNYFFEWLHWFTYAAIAWGAPYAWGALLGPLVMFLFLRFLSGIPFTEAQALRTRGEDYRDYQRSTAMLFPWPPRRAASSK